MKKLQGGSLAATLLFLCLSPVANAFSLPSSLGGAVTELKNLATGNSSGTSNTSPSTGAKPSNQSASSSNGQSGKVWSFTFTKAANPVVTSFPRLSLDILGIKPGMSVNAAKAALLANYPRAKFPDGSRSPTIHSTRYIDGNPPFQTTPLHSQSYITSITAHKATGGMIDYIGATFGGPTTGNTVVSVGRDIQFSQKSEPTLKQILSALTKKYGQQTAPIQKSTSYQARSVVVASWVFGKKGHLKTCPSQIFGSTQRCQCLTDNRESAFYVKANDYFCIEALIGTGYSPHRVKTLQLLLVSNIDNLIAAKTMAKQIKAAEATASKHIPPAKVPNF